MLHSHSDKKIKTCKVCQTNIKEINFSGKELDRLGVWNFPKKMKKGVEYNVWRAKK